MKLSTMQFQRFGPPMGKIMVALALASVLGGTTITPAFARENEARHDQGRHRGQHKVEQRRDRDEYRNRRDPYYYSAPVYVPPPAYYPPQPSPGISLFFPLDFRR